jgi:hypothetical protein
MTFEQKYQPLRESEGYIKMMRAIHESLDGLMSELDDPDTPDERVREIYTDLQKLKAANIMSTAAETVNGGE